MRRKVAIVYNEPTLSRYGNMGEEKAVVGVLDAVKAVHRALVELDYAVRRVPLQPPLENAAKSLQNIDADLLFNLFEGFDGCPETEAIVTNMLSGVGLPYTGCSSTAIALALDKAKAKAIMEASGISTPRYQVVSPETPSEFHLSYPCIVKPCGEDASHGLSQDSVVHDYDSLQKQVTRMSQLFGGRALVEEFIEGREFNATVLSNGEATVLPISEIVYSLPPSMPRVLTFAAKWELDSVYSQHTKPVCPAQIGTGEQAQIIETALAAFRLLIGHGYARVDMRLDAQDKVNVLEVNPNPDISPGTGAARQAKAASMTYSQFIEKIITLTIQK